MWPEVLYNNGTDYKTRGQRFFENIEMVFRTFPNVLIHKNVEYETFRDSHIKIEKKEQTT